MNPIETFKRQPLLFGSAIAVTDTDVDALAHRYAASMALREFDRASCDEPFLYHASTVQIGDLTVSTGFHTPIRLCTQESSIATVMLIRAESCESKPMVARSSSTSRRICSTCPAALSRRKRSTCAGCCSPWMPIGWHAPPLA
ncbi:hypothetical protein KBZ20_04550 [Vulcanococcus limneticus Candia 3F8]|uniref:hypothetical protein n=1 Tax=Vulcanococcus limneticus TaxID=2170428 RepID=UPI0012FF8553|nr:hypothetical protein [Vulcanococcus limneticus]MCP9791349.1 hypothetical protein [Vulcanococcus limneticus MW73D5]MCP9893046.1 hypothetical protein [Vulcanococcus limneticus Candia 3F8]MCP9896816.1 hypothetical protein [Vulcanococcus limneticus Candia 3B3]